MPKTLPWEDVPKRSPFLKLLTDYMWSFKPNLSVGQLAVRTGIPKQTIWGWIREGRTPRPSVLRALSGGTGIPLDALYEACGYDVPGKEVEQREADPFADMLARIQRDQRLSATAKQALIDAVRRVELGEAAAARERMIYSEEHTTIDSLPVVRPSAAQLEEPQPQSQREPARPKPAREPAPEPEPERAQRAAPRRRAPHAPHAPHARVR